MTTMKAFEVSQSVSGFDRGIAERGVPEIGLGDVLIKVLWSSVNYKDSLAASPENKIVREYPRILGIDMAGTVITSTSSLFAQGDSVFAHGYELGTSKDGGFAEYCCVPSQWLIPMPLDLDAQRVMIAGTAGFTAAEAVLALINSGVTPANGPVLVTGATGGVGSFAIALLGQLGFDVTASTGRSERAEWLKSLGASQVMGRFAEEPKPLSKETWQGVVDTVGGVTLATVLSATRYDGAVAACGNTGGVDLHTTVFPFILRGVSLLGIDSVNTPMAKRIEVWNWLSHNLEVKRWHALAGRTVDLDNLELALDEVRQGNAQGRTLVKL